MVNEMGGGEASFVSSACGGAGVGRRDLGGAGVIILLRAATGWMQAKWVDGGLRGYRHGGREGGKRKGERGGHASACGAAQSY